MHYRCVPVTLDSRVWNASIAIPTVFIRIPFSFYVKNLGLSFFEMDSGLVPLPAMVD